MPFFGVPIRNGLPIGLGSVAGFGVQQFDPLELFASGAEGVWYDPSDTSTLFQDPAGTTPVTAVEQPVGLMLDKSKGLVLGSELVTNGDFSNGTTGWSAPVSGASITNNALTFDGATSIAAGTAITTNTPTASIVAGKWYFVSYTIVGGTSNPVSVGVGGATGTARTNAGTYSEYIVTTNTTGPQVFTRTNVGVRTGSIDNISVRELPGNHAISYNGSTARPTLSARVNLLTYSEEFDNGAWTLAALNAFGSGSVANTTATLDPLGGNTADFIQENTAASTTHGVSRVVTLTAGTAQIITCSFKAATRTFAIISFDSAGGNGARAYFNLSLSGSVGTSVALGTGTLVSTPTITSLGNGWFRCQLVAKVDPAATSATLRLSMTPADNTATYTGDGASGIYIWGADFRPANIGSAVPSYQRIAAATDYDTNGFPKYLYFAGTDDGMSTPANLNLTSTDKVAVFSGVRKLSDAATSAVSEFSANSGVNSGVFVLGAPWSPASKRFAFNSNGNAGSVSEASTTSTTYNAPITSVLTGLGDISGDLSVLRIDGAQVASSTADQGTGNYGTYPLYIGARNNASLWFNGYLYGLTVVGAQLTTPQIESMESWTAGKTGITL